jgi:hypothetical protein
MNEEEGEEKKRRSAGTVLLAVAPAPLFVWSGGQRTSKYPTMSYFFGSSAPVVQIPFVPVSLKPICSTTVNEEKTLESIPSELYEPLKAKAEEFKARLTSSPSEWEVFMEDKGIKGTKRYEEGKEVAIMRSETVLPFHIVDIFEFINNNKNTPVVDPWVNHSVVLKRFSPHSWVGCVTLHGVSCPTVTAAFALTHHAFPAQQWPVISPREFVNLYHWRLLEDGSVLYFDFSAAFDELKPENADAIRGWDYVYGYMLRATEDGSGTDVHMIVDVSSMTAWSCGVASLSMYCARACGLTTTCDSFVVYPNPSPRCAVCASRRHARHAGEPGHAEPAQLAGDHAREADRPAGGWQDPRRDFSCALRR